MICPMTFKFFLHQSVCRVFRGRAACALCGAAALCGGALPRGRVLWRMGEQVTQRGSSSPAGSRRGTIPPQGAGRSGRGAWRGAAYLATCSCPRRRSAARSSCAPPPIAASFFSRLRRCLRSARGRRRGLCAAAGKSAPRSFGKILAIAAARPVFVHSGWAAEAGVLSLRAGRRGFPAPHFPGTDGPAARHESRGALAPAWPAPGRGASALGAGAFCDPAAGGAACDCGGWMI